MANKGYTAGRLVQMGTETTEGSPVVATVIYRGMAMAEDQSEITVVNEGHGRRIPLAHTYIPFGEVVVEFEETEATFEQLGYWFEAGVELCTTVGGDTGGAGHIYQYDLSDTSDSTVRTYTVETGNQQESNEVNGAFVESFTLSGAAGEAWKVSGTWRGWSMTDCAFTDLSGSVPDVEQCLFNKTTFSIDDSGGTIGGSDKTSTIIGFELNAENLQKGIRAAAGLSTISGRRTGPAEITGSITMLHDDVGEAEIAKAQAQSIRLLQLECLGAALTTAGSSYTYKTLKGTLAIQYTSIPTLDEDDGDDTVTLEWRQVYSTSLGWQTIIVNELAALT